MYPCVVLVSKGSNGPGGLSPNLNYLPLTKVMPRRLSFQVASEKRTLENFEVHCGTLSGAPGPPGGGHRRSAVAEPQKI
eukprot:753266-Hanusia_phi.AAC.1